MNKCDKMLQFEQIKEDTDDINIEDSGDKETPIPKSFILIYTDNELTEDAIPEIWGKLNEHDFGGGAENIDFIIYFDKLNKTCRIVMALYYPENNFNVPEIEEIAGYYRQVFEDFYKKNKPY